VSYAEPDHLATPDDVQAAADRRRASPSLIENMQPTAEDLTRSAPAS